MFVPFVSPISFFPSYLKIFIFPMDCFEIFHIDVVFYVDEENHIHFLKKKKNIKKMLRTFEAM